MDISVIIVNYNVRRFLENAISSVMKSAEGLQAEIIVVDNASDDGSVEMVRTTFPTVQVIANSENLGFAKANNLGLKRAKGKHLLLLNPDTILQEDTIHEMIGFIAKHPDAGLAGCKILNPDGSFQLSCRRGFPTPWVSFTKVFGLSSLFPGSKLFGRYNLTYLNPDESYVVDAISGSFMMLTRRSYDLVGGLDESFFMYGEDLDYCYRIQKAGLRVYYVHTTQIIHFKGESTQRSNLDEIELFYDAMRVFVRKHFGHSYLLKAVLSVGISLRAAAAFLARAGRPLSVAMIDFLLVSLSMVLGEFLRYGALFRLPAYAYPVVWIVPSMLVVAALSVSGVYTSNRHSVSRSAGAVITSFVFLSALVFFAKDYGFSRIVVGIAGVISVVSVPGWRLLFRFAGKGRSSSRGSLFGRRTLIVGTGESALTVLRKLRARVGDGYEVVGFVSTYGTEVGEERAGLEVVGSVENVGKVISENRVTEVIFSTDGLSYKDILSVIARSRSRGVNFRLVPNSLEAIIGKASIDELDPIPLVEIEYNIHKSVNRIVKRSFDIFTSFLLLISLYPLKMLVGAISGKGKRDEMKKSWIERLPGVFSGRLSFVGLPYAESRHAGLTDHLVSLNGQASSLGPYGLTGIVQIQSEGRMEPEETEQLKLYYAKNQSLALDMEILLKAALGRKHQS